MPHKNIANFLFELGRLKYIPRSGWAFISLRDPENIAEHSLRTAQVAFVLAVLEEIPDPCRACAMGVFHEIGEIRVGDQNKINRRYGRLDETQAVNDQTDVIGKVGREIRELWQECEDHVTPMGIIAKDADHLELMLTAKEYMEMGYLAAEDWFTRANEHLQTESAKKLAVELKKIHSNDWWKELKIVETPKR